MEVTLNLTEIAGKIKLIFRRPSDFFKKYKKEKGWQHAFVYFAVLSLVGSVLSLLYGLGIYPYLKPQIDAIFGNTGSTYTLAEVLPVAMTSFVSGILFSFVWGFVFKLWIKLFGGKGTFDQAYQLIVYSRTPIYLLSWAPVINLVALIYSLIVLYKGIREYYSLSKVRSLLAVVLGLIAVFIASYIFIMLMLSYS